MAQRFRGEWVHKVDSKGRVSIPADFRRALAEGDPANPNNPNFVLIYGLAENGYLEGYSAQGIEALEGQIEALDYGVEREFLEDVMLTQSQGLSVDDNGRIVLPAHMRDRLGTSGEVIFAGTGEKFRIWEPAKYEAERAARRAEMAEKGLTRNAHALLNRARIKE